MCHATAAALCKDLERFVANRDNASLARRAEGVNSEQQLWPLVDKVDIFVKADVLSTGAVITDMVSLGVSFRPIPFPCSYTAYLFLYHSLVAETEIPRGPLAQL